MALVQKCIDEGDEVIILANPSSRRLSRLENKPSVQVVMCGLENMKEADRELTGTQDSACDIFYHLAWSGTFGPARNNEAMQEKNVEYTLDAVQLAKRLGCHTFVGVGSQAEYGRAEGKLSPDTPANPESGYGRGKLKAGIESRRLCKELGIRHIWPRILSIYGPYDGPGTMISATIRKLLDGKEPTLTPGEQMWDYLYSEDAANALYLLGEKGKDGQVYPIGSGKARPLREYVEIMRDAIDPHLTLGFGKVSYSDNQVMYLCADISKLCEDTGFAPGVDFSEGIRRTIDWVREDKK